MDVERHRKGSYSQVQVFVQILPEALQGFGEAAAQPSTGWALRRVASEVGEGPVHSMQYGNVACALHVSFPPAAILRHLNCC